MQVIETMPLRLSGVVSSEQDTTLDQVTVGSRADRNSYDPNIRLRLKLCLQNNQNVCSEYVEAKSECLCYWQYCITTVNNEKLNSNST